MNRVSWITILAVVIAYPVLAQAPQPQAERPWWDRAPVFNAHPRSPSRFYNIKSDLTAEELREIGRHLDLTFLAYRNILGELRQNLPASFDVLIFKKQADYLTTLRYKYGINATGSGGMFFSNPGGKALAFWVENLPKRRIQHVAQHEGFHQIAHALFAGNLSPWVNEGLAEFFGEGVMVGNKLVIGQTNPRVLQHIRDAIETETFIPFRQMLTMDGQQWNMAVQSGQARLQYEQAWSMVHFLVYGDGGKYAVAFSDYLRYLNVGFRSYDAFVRAFGTDNIEGFERRWVEHARSAKASSFVTALERAEFLAAGLRELADRGEYPESFAALKERLQQIDFTYSVQMHGVTTEFAASDETLFLIPRDDLTKGDDDPVFVLEATPLRGMSQKEKRLNREKPVPFTLKTEYLEPNNVATRWYRDLDTNEFTFEVVAER